MPLLCADMTNRIVCNVCNLLASAGALCPSNLYREAAVVSQRIRKRMWSRNWGEDGWIMWGWVGPGRWAAWMDWTWMPTGHFHSYVQTSTLTVCQSTIVCVCVRLRESTEWRTELKLFKHTNLYRRVSKCDQRVAKTKRADSDLKITTCSILSFCLICSPETAAL